MPISKFRFNSKSIESKMTELVEQTEEVLSRSPLEIMEHIHCNIITYIVAMGPIPNNDQSRYGDNFSLTVGFAEEFDLSNQTLREALYDTDGSVKQSFGLDFKCVNLASAFDPSVSHMEPSDCYGKISIEITGFIPNNPESIGAFKDYYKNYVDEESRDFDEDFNAEDLLYFATDEDLLFGFESKCDLDKQTLLDSFCSTKDSPSLCLDIDYHKWLIANNENYSLKASVSGSTSDTELSDCCVSAFASMSIMGPVPFELNAPALSQAFYDGSVKPSLRLSADYWDNRGASDYLKNYIDNDEPAYGFRSYVSGFVPGGDELMSI